MAIKKFIIEIEEGATDCDNCQFSDISCIGLYCIDGGDVLDCHHYNLTTMKIKELEKKK